MHSFHMCSGLSPRLGHIIWRCARIGLSQHIQVRRTGKSVRGWESRVCKDCTFTFTLTLSFEPSQPNFYNRASAEFSLLYLTKIGHAGMWIVEIDEGGYSVKN